MIKSFFNYYYGNSNIENGDSKKSQEESLDTKENAEVTSAISTEPFSQSLELVANNAEIVTSDDTTTVLHIAAQTGNLSHIRQYIADNYDLDRLDCNGHTALYQAIWCEKLNVVEILIRNGAAISQLLSTNNAKIDKILNAGRLADSICGINVSYRHMQVSEDIKDLFLDRLKILILKNGIESSTEAKINLETNYRTKFSKGLLEETTELLAKMETMILVEDIPNMIPEVDIIEDLVNIGMVDVSLDD